MSVFYGFSSQLLTGVSLGLEGAVMQREVLEAAMGRVPSDRALSATALMLVFGSLFGTLCAPLVSKRLGQYATIQIANACSVVVNAAMCLPFRTIVFLTARFALGAAAAIITAGTPSFIASRVPRERRSLILSGFQLFLCLGGVLASVCILLTVKVSNGFWRLGMIVSAAINLATAFGLRELTKGTTEAKAGAPDSESTAVQSVSQSGRQLVLIAVCLGLAQQFTGINVAIAHCTVLVGGNPALASLYVSLLNCCFNGLGLLVRKWPHRIVFFAGIAVCLCAQVLFALHLKPVIPTALLLLGFQAGPGPLFFTLCSEVLQAQSYISVAFVTNFASNAAVVSLYPPLRDLAWPVYSIVMLASAAVLFRQLPETQLDGGKAGGAASWFTCAKGKAADATQKGSEAEKQAPEKTAEQIA